jgi:HEPN domain-containing protein
MKEVVDEWIAKAEGDFMTAQREFAVQIYPNYDAVCFHAQQCAEKYLKALLVIQGVTPPKIHDLPELDRLLAPLLPEWQWPLEELTLLSRSAVISRYPGETAELLEAQIAFDICKRMRDRLRSLL